MDGKIFEKATTVPYIREHPEDAFELLASMWDVHREVLRKLLSRPELVKARRELTAGYITLGVIMNQFEAQKPLDELYQIGVAEARAEHLLEEAAANSEELRTRFEREVGPIAH